MCKKKPTVTSVVSALSILLFLAASACDSDGADDANTDTGSDSALDTGVDTGTDSGTDSASDTGVDTTPLPENTYAADDENIRYVGRVDFTNPEAPRFSAPGVYIEAWFTGTGVTVHIDDIGQWEYNNFYDVIVDDEVLLTVDGSDGLGDYLVADNLENTTHHVMVVKRSASGMGKGSFLGFTFAGEIAALPAERPHKMVIFGDSIQEGSGVEGDGSAPECADWIESLPFANGHMAPGSMVARSIDADYHVIAVGGMGLMINYEDTYEPRHVPDIYNLLYIEDQPPNEVEYDMSQFVPDAVMIALGTNDYGTGPESAADYPRPGPTMEEFRDAMIAFVDTLLTHWPDTWVFLTSSEMLGDAWPAATDTRLTTQRTALAEAAANYESGKVVYVQIPKVSPGGCSSHPNVENNISTAAVIETAIREATGW